MARSVASSVAREREKNGLIVLEAHYGLASAFSERGIRRTRRSEGEGNGMGEKEEEEGEGEEEQVVIDVTIPVQALVADSRMHIPGGRGKVSDAE